MTDLLTDITEEEIAEARRYRIDVRWSDEDQAFLASAPDLRGTTVHADTADEAVTKAQYAVIDWLYGVRATGGEIPEPTVEAPHYGADAIRAIRKRLGLTQAAFAAALNVSIQSVKHWEQGLRTPEGGNLRLIEIADLEPGAFQRASTHRYAS